MTPNENHSDRVKELHELNSAQELGRFTQEQAERLEYLLSSDEELLRLHVQYMYESAILPELIMTLPDEEDPRSARSGERDSKKAISTPRLFWGNKSLTPFAALSCACVASIATILVLFYLGTIQLPWRENDSRLVQGENDQAIPSKFAIVGSLVGSVDCVWGDGLTDMVEGEAILEGQRLALKSGLAELAFESGARVILEGPAEFVVTSPMNAELCSGSISVIAPRSARGFKLRTPHADIVDLGTEFGVWVAPSSKTEVHVFTGSVVSWCLDKDGHPMEASHEVVAGQSISFQEAGNNGSLGEAAPQRFVRSFAKSLPESKIPPLPVKSQLALWLAADVLVSCDEDDQVVAWRDILAGDNQSREDALQNDIAHRPKLVKDVINGKPAVRFDGKSSYLLTTPLASTSDQTLFFVFTRLGDPKPSSKKGERSDPGQLINYNGAPHPLLMSHDVSARRVLHVDDRGRPGIYWGRVWGQIREGQGRFNMGSVACQTPLALGEPGVLAYAYHPSSDLSAIYLNGSLQNESTAPDGYVMITSRKVIGRRPRDEAFFDGDIAEVIIYNGALDREDIDQVNHYLIEKYGIRSFVGKPAPTPQG